MMKVMTVVEGGDGGWVDAVVLCCGVQGKSPQRERERKKEREKKERERDKDRVATGQTT